MSSLVYKNLINYIESLAFNRETVKYWLQILKNSKKYQVLSDVKIL